ncbi:hypothetical protein D0Y65_038831 [Glycine soja]|uniref:GRF1-interacting factor 3 n=1 Tax=Glycine soja TaxID=3848 RepID=A0A445H6M7_GLYSO|nr:hypothetical protein D0Y65_038831 [Glycine soja]
MSTNVVYMRQKIMELKKKAGEATTPSGCSFMNLEKFIKEHRILAPLLFLLLWNLSRLQRNLMYLAAIADSQPQPSPLAGQPFSMLQQQPGMHNQLGISSIGRQGLHMLQSEATNVGGNATIGAGGGFPDFVRIGSGKQDIGISGEGRGGNSNGHSGDGGETLNYLKAAGDGS